MERVFLTRAAHLAEEARRFLLVAAAEPGAELDLLKSAADVAELDGVVAEIEDSGLARYDAHRLVFFHPLARSAVYGDATIQQRQEAHLALAQALHARGDQDRAVWHRAAACLGADGEIAGALDEVALRARQRSGFAAAAAASERAAELSGVASERTQRLIAAADAAWLAGQPVRSSLLLDRAEQTATEATARGRLFHLRALAASRRGEVREAHRLFMAGAELLSGSDPVEAVEMLAEAVEAAGYAGDRTPLPRSPSSSIDFRRGPRRASSS